MKTTFNLFNFCVIGLLALTMVFMSCEKDKDPEPEPEPVASVESLNALITTAQGLLSGASEGFGLGQYQFGSIALLQDVINNATTVATSGTNDMSLVDNAQTQLQAAIDAFRATEVLSVATPWIQQIPNNRLLITDSDAGTAGGMLGLIDNGRDFTIELRMNPVSLQNLGFSNSLISAAKQFDGDPADAGVMTVDEGFHLRYFDDGSMQFINGGAGSANPWQEIPRTDAGTLVEGQWHHVAYVHSGADRILYVDGIEVGKGALDYKSIADNPSVTGISIGNSFDWVDRVSNALVEDVRVWSKALAATELNNQSIMATGDGLEAWFPLKSDQGSEVTDVSGNYKAVLGEFVSWAPNGDISQVPKDYTALMSAIMDGNTFLAGITEGMEVGNHGIGTTMFVQDRIDAGMAVVDQNGSQTDAAIAETAILDAIDAVSDNTIAEAGATGGLLYDLEAAGTVGFRLTRTDGAPPAMPEGSYTIEMEVNLNDFLHPNGSETSLLGTGALQFRTQVSVSDSDANGNEGAIEFYVEGAGWTCACSGAGTMVAGEWASLAAVYDAPSNTSKIYLNGVEVASGSDGAYTRRNNNGWMDMWLGNRGGDGNRLDGSARDLRVWSVARSASEVNADITGTENGLEMYFPLDMKNAQFFVDKTGNYYGDRRGVTYLD